MAAFALRASIFLCLLGLLGDAVQAQRAVVQPARQVGEYAGVRPGSAAPPPGRRRVRAGAQIVTWPGFEPRGGGRFFLQTTGPIDTELSGSEGRFEILLRGATTHLRNTRRWIDTRFFNTPVRRARIERRGRGRNRQLVMVFEMRALVRPSITTQDGEGGFRYIFIDFPAGDYIPAELRRESAAPEAPQREDERPPQNTDGIDMERLDNERPPGQ